MQTITQIPTKTYIITFWPKKNFLAQKKDFKKSNNIGFLVYNVP